MIEVDLSETKLKVYKLVILGLRKYPLQILKINLMILLKNV